MSVLLFSHPRYQDHRASPHHPEQPARLEAVLGGIQRAGVDDALIVREPRVATVDEVSRVHPKGYVDAIERFCEGGGGRIDADTGASEASFDAAMLAAGAGLDAVERLSAGEADAAFCAVRPPGHHALPARSMGFCIFNNVAVTAMTLADAGERVLVVDYDAHHGNGTQDVFYDDPRVVYISMHEWPLYPGTGALHETGNGAGLGATVNLPFPAGTTGDVYLASIDEVVAPLAATFDPTWLLISAGFDAHRADPLTDLGLSSGDYGLMTARLAELVPHGRVITFLEGGYDLDALEASAGACVAALVGKVHAPEKPTAGGPGHPVVGAALKVRERMGEK
jgi:acetoin utilization deacetylase AcuC-like enzyme